MAKCIVDVVLEKPNGTFGPGDTVVGMVTVDVTTDCTCNGLRASLRWRTHGRGNRKTNEFDSAMLFEGEWKAGEQHVHPFELTLPDTASPTYAGHILNLDWEVHATADIPWAFDPEGMAPIQVVVPPGGPHDPGPRFSDSKEQVAQGKGGRLLLAGMVMLGVAMLGAVMPMILMSEGESDPEMYGAVCIVLGTIVPVVALVMWLGMKRQVAASRMGDIAIEGPTGPVRAGDEVTLTLRFTPDRDTVGGVTATFRGVERCVSGSGTNKRTHTHEIICLEQTLRPHGDLPANQLVETTARFRLPDTIDPSFEASENALRWEIQIDVDMDKWPDWHHVHLLHVAP